MPRAARKSEPKRSKTRSKRGIFEGRPSSYKAEFSEQARKLCEMGATDFQVAQFLGIDRATFYRWRNTIPSFCDALKTGKYPADEQVERTLYERATGYSFEAEEVFQYQGEIIRATVTKHVPPDATSMIFWLKNRRPQQWRDRQESVNIDVHMSLGELVNSSYKPDLPALPEPKVIEHDPGETENNG